MNVNLLLKFGFSLWFLNAIIITITCFYFIIYTWIKEKFYYNNVSDRIIINDIHSLIDEICNEKYPTYRINNPNDIKKYSNDLIDRIKSLNAENYGIFINRLEFSGFKKRYYDLIDK